MAAKTGKSQPAFLCEGLHFACRELILDCCFDLPSVQLQKMQRAAIIIKRILFPALSPGYFALNSPYAVFSSAV